VRSRQSESSRAVIEYGRVPRHRVVATGTISCGERRARGGVSRIVRLLPGGQVASRVSAIVGRDRQIVIVIDVASRTGDIRVAVGEGKSRGGVVECRGRPTYSRVARGTILKSESCSCRWMDRVCGLLPGRQVALGVPAIGRRNGQIVIVIDVARSARHVRVAIGQQETRYAVVESSVQPGIEGMARFARGWEICRHVIGIRGLLKIRQMTRRTSRRKPHILSNCGVFVALFALDHCVSTEERKSVEVLFDRLHRYAPAQNGVALGAVGAILTAMDVRVTVRAVLPDIGKDGLGVTLGAVNLFVHAAEGISRGVMIEFGDSANGTPTRAGVAIFAGNFQWAVRTSTRLPLGGCRTCNG